MHLMSQHLQLIGNTLPAFTLSMFRMSYEAFANDGPTAAAPLLGSRISPFLRLMWPLYHSIRSPRMHINLRLDCIYLLPVV